MPRNGTTVISADLDGAELRREQHNNPNHVRCSGKADQDVVKEIIDAGGRKSMIALPLGAWDRIFGRKEMP